MSRIPPWAQAGCAVFLLAWGGNHFTPLLHLYERLGHYAAWQANLLLGMYVFGLVPGLLLAAAISDQHGRKRVLGAGMVAGTAGSALLMFGLNSFPLLCIGRTLAGIGVGVAMSVGTSWIKELSAPPYDSTPPPGAGARRPSLTLTLGFGLGALVTGLLAQWGPAPSQLPYAVHLTLSLISIPLLMAAPETLGSMQRATGPWWRDLRVPAAGHRRFRRLVVPAAPWIFAAAGVAYAIMPAIAAPQLGDWTTLYATALTTLTLGAGAMVQPFVGQLDQRTGGKALPIGLALMTAGMALSVAASLSGEPGLGLAVAVVLGVAYGVVLVAGLTRVQAIAEPYDLAGLTGVYYALAYAGFLLPTVLAALLPIVPYPASLTVITLVCAACLAAVRTSTPQIREQGAERRLLQRPS